MAGPKERNISIVLGSGVATNVVPTVRPFVPPLLQPSTQLNVLGKLITNGPGIVAVRMTLIKSPDTRVPPENKASGGEGRIATGLVKISEEPVQKAVAGERPTIKLVIVGPVYSSSTVNMGSPFFFKDWKLDKTVPPHGGFPQLITTLGSLFPIEPAFTAAADIASSVAKQKTFTSFMRKPPRELCQQRNIYSTSNTKPTTDIC
jgi:hypothetical protein